MSIDVVGGLQFAVVEVGHVEEGAESVRRHNVGPALPCQQACSSEMIGVRVGDHDGMDPAERDAGPLHTFQQRIPRRLAREPGVHQRKTAVILEGIGVDVTESREVDRELQAQDPGCHLDDVRRRILLLLLLDAWHHSAGPSLWLQGPSEFREPKRRIQHRMARVHDSLVNNGHRGHRSAAVPAERRRAALSFRVVTEESPAGPQPR